MFLIRYLTILTTVSAASLCFAPFAYAHLPAWGEAGGENQIDDMDVSTAFYQEIKDGTQVDTYTFTGEAGQFLHAGINIPAVKGMEDYGVTMALLGPGLPAAGLGELPEAHADAEGALIFPSEVSDDFFEPFTQTRYRGRQTVEMELPASGEYHIMVWNPDADTGKYVIDVGEREAFGLLEILKMPYWWVRVHLFFGHSTYLALGVVALATLIGLLYRRRRRPANRDTFRGLHVTSRLI